MEKLIKVIHNAQTGEVIEREFNAEELAIYKAEQAVELARLEAEAEVANAKAALLERLGITAQEAKLLLS